MGKSSGSDRKEGWSKKRKAKMYYQKQGRHERGGRGGAGSRGGRGGQGSSGGWRGGSRRDHLDFGMKGFLCSCNFNEKDCVKEAYNLLNEYYNEEEDKVESRSRTKPESGEGEVAAAPESEPSKTDDYDKDDIEKAIKEEIQELKSDVNKYRFKSVDAGVQNLVFISTTLQSPAKLAHRILQDLLTKKEQKSKFLLRMLPIDAVCRSSDYEATFRKLVPKYFPAGQFSSFQIVFKSRYNNSISREEVIKTLAEIVVQQNPLSVVDLANAQSTIIVEVIKNKVCFGLLKDFALLKKYNLFEVATAAVTPATSSSTVASSTTPAIVPSTEAPSEEEMVPSANTAPPEQDISLSNEETPIDQ